VYIGEWVLLIRRKKREMEQEVLKYQARLDRVSRTAADRKKILSNRLREATRAH
jgi:hypothetical protein